MAQERRGTQPPIPERLHNFLNKEQMLTVQFLERFHCHLMFVRRFNVPAPIPVVADSTRGNYGVIERDGTLNWKSALHLRH